MVRLTVNSAEVDSSTAAPVPSITAPAERRNIQPSVIVPFSSSPEPEAVKSKVLLVYQSSLNYDIKMKTQLINRFSVSAYSHQSSVLHFLVLLDYRSI